MIAGLTDNMRGAAFMSVSMAGFVVNDTLVKLASSDMSVFQLLFVRGLMASALIAVIAWRAGAFRAHIVPRDRRVLALRVVGEMAAATLFLTALFQMPLANVTAILQSGPLGITLAAAVFLGEPVGWRRVSAIIIGFTGVLLIVRPGAEGFSSASLFAIAAVAFVVLRELATRQLSPGVPSLLVVFATASAVSIMGGAVTLFDDWRPLSGPTLALLAGSAIAVNVGYFFGVKAVRVGEIGFVAPFRYAVMIWALVLGYAVFGDLPDALTLTGAALVVGSGVYSFHREQRLARAAAAAARRAEGARGVL
ncbi:DMT family transporter [Limibaculum sp. M0105]|uniref:DMT family transporter n=1 Tax=Thermohalobaculum xanthum TaxID=2753746 RepID=A0A8J7M3S3_9RHOB|nr:DMT family transporter [Thermohalobaculum xanthum]MBK0397821.1 DMT family transporter [Thermohalobaculum xanthum]